MTAALAGDAVPGPRDVVAPLLLHLAEAAGMEVALVLGAGGAITPLTMNPRR